MYVFSNVPCWDSDVKEYGKVLSTFMSPYNNACIGTLLHINIMYILNLFHCLNIFVVKFLSVQNAVYVYFLF